VEIGVEWSQGDDSRGWVYYEPETTRIQIANANRFEDRTIVAVGKKVEKLDLKRFFKQP
jgi:hypothetical protein